MDGDNYRSGVLETALADSKHIAVGKNERRIIPFSSHGASNYIPTFLRFIRIHLENNHFSFLEKKI